MTSKRDKLKQINQNNQENKQEEVGTTIVDELVENYTNNEPDQIAPPQETPPDPAKAPIPDLSGELINVIDKSHVGRPKVLEGVYKPISARLKIENYEYARKVGGRFGGMNAYINYLIEQDIRKNLTDNMEHKQT